MSDYKNIDYTIADTIGTLTLKRPPVNALGHDILAEIRKAADQAAADGNANKLRALIIRGEGKCFCAGADLKERMETPQTQVSAAVKHISTSIRAVGNIPVPVIAVVHGVAMGGGFELALAADLRVVTADAKIGLRETALAIIPGAGGTQRLPKIIGYSKALYWIASGRVFSGQEACAQGAADFIANTEQEALDIARAVAGEIAANGPIAVRQAKKAIQASYDFTIREGLDKEFELYQPVILTKDRTEGLKAFQEKRAPVYRGE